MSELNEVSEHGHHRATDTPVCSQHSAMEEFKVTVKDEIKTQWQAINGIRQAAWVSALSTIGTLISVIITLLFDKMKVH
jgi:hypothetical protein